MCATEPKAAAETPLLSDTSEVILAQWQYGLGRAVAWTSDAGQDWAADWGEWPQNQRFWAQMVRWTMPSPLNPQLATQIQVDGNDVTVAVDSVDEQGNIRNLLNTEVEVAGPEQRAFSLNLPQTAPGTVRRHTHYGQGRSVCAADYAIRWGHAGGGADYWRGRAGGRGILEL